MKAKTMKDSDVRVGNIVGIPIEWATVDQIGDECTVQLQDGEYACIPWTAIEPIPMTDKWRAKLGLDSTGCIRIGLDVSTEVLQVTTDNQTLIYDTDENFICLRNAEFVHGIQNLYHALTGKEL